MVLVDISLSWMVFQSFSAVEVIHAPKTILSVIRVKLTEAMKHSAKAKLLLLKLIQIFARAVLVMKKLEIEETKTT